MNKTVKRKMILSILCMTLGIVALTFEIINFNLLKEEFSSYLNGFAFGIGSVGLYLMYQTIRAIKNPKVGKELENMENDERLKMINQQAMSITFRCSLGVEAVIGFLLAYLGKMEIAQWVSFIITIQVLVYLYIYHRIQSRN
ncbi:hypothetical protein D3C72_1563150 [compost metagenome]